MKLSEIFERAAERPVAHGACWAIIAVEGDGFIRHSKACDFFRAIFKPHGCNRLYWWDMSEKGHAARRFALLFAAAIARDEGK